jgi:hypothetical protein
MLAEHSTRGAFVFVSRHFHHRQHPNFPTFLSLLYHKICSESASDFSFDFVDLSYFGGNSFSERKNLQVGESFFLYNIQFVQSTDGKQLENLFENYCLYRSLPELIFFEKCANKMMEI